jgi:hypothetical protein
MGCGNHTETTLNNKVDKKTKFKKLVKTVTITMPVLIDTEPNSLSLLEAEDVLGYRISLD